MDNYKTENLRNIGLIGHSGSGKTILAESILYVTKTIERLGSIEDGSTVSDFEVEEKKRKISVSASINPCIFDKIKINIIDIPGYFDFCGEMIEGLSAADTAIINVSGVSGIKVGTEKAWEYVEGINLPRAFFINKLDRENSNFEKVLKKLQSKFGMTVVPIQYPIGREENFIGIVNVISEKAKVFNFKTKKMEEKEVPKELKDIIEKYRNMIIEAVAENDEKLLDKYISEGTLSEAEIYKGLIEGCSRCDIAPVMCGSALKGIGIETLLEDIEYCFPKPCDRKAIEAMDINNNKQIKIKIKEDEKFSAIVFKTLVDPFVGKLSIFRVITGNLNSDSTVYNPNKKKEEKIGAMYFLRGKNEIPAKKIVAGDIGAVSKLLYTSTGDTLCEKTYPVVFEGLKFPSPNVSMAVLPKTKGDEDKISNGLNRLKEEDLTIIVKRDIENAETIIKGLGETHIEIIASKLKNKFGAEVILRNPRVRYRETIKSISDVEGKHKKQSGGHGQYGDVVIKFEPRKDAQDELLFVDEVVGGAVPRQYIPAVEKGLKECVCHGILAGYPVIKLKATLHDGSYHSVDSSEMAFKIAASIAFKKGLESAKPVLLEPIMHLEAVVPEESMGDIIADINKRRGKVLGMETEGTRGRVIGEVPEAEMFQYASSLKSLTAARGMFSTRFERYEEVPETEAKKVIEEAKNRD